MSFSQISPGTYKSNRSVLFQRSEQNRVRAGQGPPFRCMRPRPANAGTSRWSSAERSAGNHRGDLNDPELIGRDRPRQRCRDRDRSGTCHGYGAGLRGHTGSQPGRTDAQAGPEHRLARLLACSLAHRHPYPQCRWQSMQRSRRRARLSWRELADGADTRGITQAREAEAQAQCRPRPWGEEVHSADSANSARCAC
jgi:hypothetical protein